MIQLQVNSVVLSTLQKHFPTPKNSAARAFDKYVKLLTEQLTQSVMLGRSGWMIEKGMYSISIYRQRNRGSQIGRDKIRLQNWLEDNDLELFKVILLGTNMSKRLTVIKLTDLVTVKNTVTVFKTKEEQETEDLKALLDDQTLSNKHLFERLYPEVETLLEAEVREMFDIVPVDMMSLSYYMHWLEYNGTLIDRRKKLQYMIQADTILRVAQHTEGFYFQRKKESAFGRNYYSGASVQNVNKELRRAMLGRCWEYDIRSSVFSWKMGYAQECYQTLKTTEPFEKVFAVTLNYLSDKKDFMMTVRYYTFQQDTEVTRDLQDKLLKQAVTAISFGARKGTRGWVKSDGEWKNPALVEILKNQSERERFMNCAVVKQFIHEQNLIDKYIYTTCKVECPSFMASEEVRTQCGLLSKSKVIAYLYQHFETQIMDVAAAEIEKRGRKVLARIHDAIITDKRLGMDNKTEIEEAMRKATSNPYWHLTAKELLPFNRPYSLDKDEIDTHRERIKAETAIAEEKKSRGLLKTIFE